MVFLNKNKRSISDSYFFTVLQNVSTHSRLLVEKDFMQHGNTSCLLHSIAVAYYSYRIAMFLKPFTFYQRDLIRGALLHDYFLYDWHIPDSSHKWHGFFHPKKALEHAQQDFNLSKIEKDIIKKHMFPLTPVPPRYKESLLVCVIDKICSIYEIFTMNAYSNQQIRTALDNVLNQRKE